MSKSDIIIKEIAGFADYSISVYGNIYSKKRNRSKELKPETGPYGHQRVALCKDGKIKRKLVHRLVLETFVGPCPVGMQACHINGNPLCNHVYNLRWDTPKNNHRDAIRHGTHSSLHQIDGQYGNRKLSIQDVKEIKYLLGCGVTQRLLGKLYEVNSSTIWHINAGKTWKEV